MGSRSRPVILSSREVSGILPSSSFGNLSWSDDGQCMFINKRGVTIMTPYFASTLPGPAKLIDPNLNLEYPMHAVNKASKARKSQAAEDLEDIDMDNDTPIPGQNEAGPSNWAKLARPKSGEVRWWVNGFDVDRDGNKDRIYLWNDIGDEYSTILTDREVFLKSAIWSPSGLNDLGGSLLAVMTTQGQISIYTPQTDPSSKPWEEIADLTILQRDETDLRGPIPESEAGSLLPLRATCMAWSQAVSHPAALGIDGSLLAVANRGGGISLWRYGHGRRFGLEKYVDVTDHWISHMSWSPWDVVDERTCSTRLAMVMTDGSACSLSIQRTIVLDSSGGNAWSLHVDPPVTVDVGDKRLITAISWIHGILVWTKAGSVHLWAEPGLVGCHWDGLKIIRLQSTGNWAGSNPYGSCTGLSCLHGDCLLITTSTLTQHIIISVMTSPTLAPPADSISYAIAARDCLLDGPRSEGRLATESQTDKEMSTLTLGFASLGNDEVYSFASEVLSLHDLDSAQENQRNVQFILADFGGVLASARNIIDDLEKLVEDPPILTHHAPARVLLSPCLRLLALRQPSAIAQDLLDVCATQTSFDMTQLTLRPDETPYSALTRLLWGSPSLNSLRLRFVLAQWATTALEASSSSFTSASDHLQAQIQQVVLAILLQWLETMAKGRSMAFGGLDAQSVTLLSKSLKDVDGSVAAHPSLTGDTQIEEPCPACGEPVDLGQQGVATCQRGHEWSRCCLTQLLITTPAYRVCSICPGVSLLPHRHESHPIPVDKSGKDHDWERFSPSRSNPNGHAHLESIDGQNVGGRGHDGANGVEDSKGDKMVQEILEAGIVCPLCCGRWTRVA